MREDIKSILLNAALTLVVSALLQGLTVYIFHNDGIIELSSSKIEDGKYENVISIKNMSNSKYMKQFELLINDDIKTEENKIIVEKIEPSKIKNIVFYSNKIVLKKDITIVNNNMRIEIDSLNEYTDYKIRYLVLILIYIGINSIIIICSYSKYNKEKELNKKEMDSVEKEHAELLEKVEKLEEKTDVLKIAHSMECSDLEKENEFYKSICLKLVGNSFSKEELEKLVRKELKTFSKKNIEHMNYNDIISISTLLYRKSKEENIND